jgi:CheY-like chemotaxis protein
MQRTPEPPHHDLPDGADDLPDTAVVLADDLIWSSRLVAGLRALGVRPTPVASLAAFERSLDGADHVLVDLTARTYDGLAAIRLAASRGAVVLCVAQHDDAELRRSALAAGARRVVPYRTMFERGPATLRRWLREPAQPIANDAAGPIRAAFDE